MPTKGADEYAVAELKNDVTCSGRRFGPEGVSTDSIEIGRCECQDRVECTARFANQGLAESAVKDAKDAVRTNLACLVRRFGQEFQEDTQS